MRKSWITYILIGIMLVQFALPVIVSADTVVYRCREDLYDKSKTRISDGATYGTGVAGALSLNVPIDVGSYIEFDVDVAKSDIYDISAKVRKRYDRGKFSFSIDGETEVGEHDLYNSSTGTGKDETLNLAQERYLEAGTHKFRFTVTGRNSSSSGYILTFFNLTLTAITGGGETGDTKRHHTPDLQPVAGGAGAPEVGTGVVGARSLAGTPTVGSWIEFTLPVDTPGYYNIGVTVRKGPTRGICSLSINESFVSSGHDLYSSTLNESSADEFMLLTEGMFLAEGDNRFKFTVTGQNARSQGYILSFYDIILTETEGSDDPVCILNLVNYDETNIVSGYAITRNIAQENSDAIIICAVYRANGTLDKAQTSPVTLTDGSHPFNFEITPPGDGKADYRIKIMLWRRFHKMNSMANPLNIQGIVNKEDYFMDYIDSMEKSEDFEPTGINKGYYLDVLEMCLDAYNYSQFSSMSASADIQSYSRIVCVMGALLSEGRLHEREQDYYSLWINMMDKACSTIKGLSRKQENDFSVKELMLAYKAMKDKVKPEHEDKPTQWHSDLSAVNPYSIYQYQVNGSKSVNNINVYNMAGEYLRFSEGMIGKDALTKYFGEHWPWHLPGKFDENSMYLDPNNPILYDITTRVQIQLITGFGYDGEYNASLDAKLKNAGIYTMFMQSTAGHLPYGGRSNQYLFNEALIASNCEYEAARHSRLGNDKLAGAYKRSAHLAIASIKRWLDEGKHIKNMYANKTIGTESYGYFDKYMVTTGCFLYIGYLFADDSIEEFPAPSEEGGFVFKSSDKFHKIFANCQDYSIEIDTAADYTYDSTGLGRIHKKGAPAEIALSIPMTATPNYTMPVGTTKANASLCPGWDDGNGGIQYLSAIKSSLKNELIVISQTADRVEFELTYTGTALSGCKGVVERYVVDSSGVAVDVSLIEPKTNNVYYQTPIFLTNGKEASTISAGERDVNVAFNGFNYTVSSNGGVVEGARVRTANRNGEYSLYTFITDTGKISMRFAIEGVVE